MRPDRSRRASRLTAMAAAIVVAATTLTAAATGPVESFTPQGTVKGVRQVTARFAAPMVPFGDPRELDPFSIDCAAKGRGRWADSRNWVYDFAQDLPAGVRCRFTLKPGLTALDGSALDGSAQFEFATGGPAILRSLPDEGSRIDEQQVFILGLDAPATKESVIAHAYCTATGVRERIPVRLIGGDERRLILDARKSFVATYLRALVLDPDSGRARVLAFSLPPSGSDDERFRQLRDAPDSPLVTLGCARTLPANAEVKLVWGKGIAAASGVATTADQALAFRVRPDFRATFSCQRVNRNAQCLPLTPLALSFTAPVARRDAKEIRLVDAAGKAYPAKLPPGRTGGGADADGVDAVSFGPGLPEKTAFRLELPAGLKDDAGRTLANATSFPLKVATDELPPLAKFPADFGIVESVLPDKETPLLPVTVRNLEPTIAGTVGTAAKGDAGTGAANGNANAAGPKGDAAASGAKSTAAPAPLPANGRIPGVVARVAPGDDMKIVDWLRRVEAGSRIDHEWDPQTGKPKLIRHGGAQSIFTAKDGGTPIAIPKPLGAKSFEVIGIPLAAPGFYVVELASPRLGAALFGATKPYYVRTAALVTDLAVTFKLGRESSLVWVTRLSDAKPVAGAKVQVRDCGGKSHFQGTTDADGILRIARALPPKQTLPGCGPKERREYFVTARVGDDLSFVFSDWGEGITPWRYNVPTGNWTGPYVAHAVLDRSLVRAGETVSMKLFVRQQTGQGFALVPRAPLSDTLQVRHRGSDRKYTVPVSWHGTQDGEASFAVPADAPTGTYDIVLSDRLSGKSKEPEERRAGEFRVEAFRVPLLRARLQPVAAPWINRTEVSLDLQVSYLAGGGARNLPVRLRTALQPKTTTFDDFDDYQFAAGNVVEGREDAVDSGARFNLPDADDDADDDGAPGTRTQTRLTGTAQNLTLDAAGGARATVGDLGRSETPRDLVAELEYRDPNGETLTSATRQPLWPAQVLLGIKAEGWAATRERLKFTVAAVDVNGKPVAGVRVATDAFKRDYYAHRRRLIGGFYAYDYGSETARIGGADLCSGETDAQGLLACEVKPPASGNVILRAQAKDAAGNPTVTRAEVWIAAGDEWSYASGDADRIDLIPEKKRYEPGATARLQLRSPFREATVLVTVEREGVLDAFVRRVDRTEPMLELPVKGSYAPNVFVSAFTVRGRIAGVAPTALIDLAKPSWKMGLAEIKVGWAAHELAVKVVPDATTYKVRDKAKVAISVRRPDGSAPPKGAEIALAAVDEGLLELLPNDSWKLLDAMMVRRGEEVETSTGEMQVIGRRHFGRKALPPGGGGGRQSTRELFDTLLLWKARVPLDDAGNATVEVPLNDSLTGFRIVAVANAGAGLFGTGEASIRTTQDLMLQAGLPPLVREGDRFRAGVTVRNATQETREVTVTARYGTGTGAGSAGAQLAPQQVKLAGGEAREFGWDVTVPANVERLDWQFSAASKAPDQDSGSGSGSGSGKAGDQRNGAGDKSGDPPGASTKAGEQPGAGGKAAEGITRDALKVSQKVIPAVPERTLQATLFQQEGPTSMAIERPADALPGRGGVSVQLQARLTGDLADVRAWFERYPFTCFEQRVSTAIGLADRKRWDALMRTLPDFLDKDGLVKYFTLLSSGDDALTAYVLAVADAAGWKIPDDPRQRMEQGLVGFVEGRVVRYSPLPTADLAIRKIAALSALARGKQGFKASWLDSIAIEPNLWPTSAVIDWYQLLTRVPALPKRAERLAEATRILRSRLNFQGTRLTLSTEKTDALWWLMVSADSNANRLLLAVADAPEWKADLPRLVTGALGRMQAGRWNTTVANAWGVLALDRVSRQLESTPVTGTTTASLGPERFDYRWQDGAAASVFTRRLSWPAARSELTLAHQGTGAPWVTVSSIAAVPLKAPLSSGYTIERSVSPVEQKAPGRWTRGDVARVKLAIDAQSDMTWVVVADPIPAGSTALGRGLGGDSALLTAGEKSRGMVWPAFEERTFEGYRGYFRYVPKGRFVVEYTVRLNNPGTFMLPPTRVEAMYAPEMFGEVPNGEWVVQP